MTEVIVACLVYWVNCITEVFAPVWAGGSILIGDTFYPPINQSHVCFYPPLSYTCATNQDPNHKDPNASTHNANPNRNNDKDDSHDNTTTRHELHDEDDNTMHNNRDNDNTT